MTQEYTPVAWQDETTSQQGTLINAERLNQMQTAHHYADGFEEVDAVPTADPGVSYHKIVYCTADSTFYRWDGTEWSADIDDDTKRLLEQEIARATAAEGELASDIEAEETARTQADTALGQRITAETSARTAADTALGGRIDAETAAREAADLDLGDDIGAETARATAAEQANAGVISAHIADKQNPHEVTKAQVGLGNVDNTSDADKPISTATQAALDGKASTTAVQTLDTRVGTLETGLADTYNKSQVDTYLAAKADDEAVVKLSGNQSIAGIKTFTSQVWAQNTIRCSPQSDIRRGIVTLGAGSTNEIYFVGHHSDTGNFRIEYAPSLKPLITASIDGVISAPNQRAYDTTHTEDVVTIGTLKASTDVVHRSGAETIEGTKTFSASEYSEIAIRSNRKGAAQNIGGLHFINGYGLSQAYITGTVDGRVVFDLINSTTKAVQSPNQRAYAADNISDVATIGTLDQYTPMVRTSGNQTISGIKTANDHILALTSVQNVPAVIPREVGSGWVKLYEATDTNHANAILAMLPRRATSNPGFGILAVGGHNNGTVICKWMAKDLVNTNYLDKVMVTIEEGVITVWGANISATDNVNMRIVADVYNGSYMQTYNGFKAATDTAIYTMTTDGDGNIIGYTDSDSVVHTFIAYETAS